jgi:hypothetical protein
MISHHSTGDNDSLSESASRERYSWLLLFARSAESSEIATESKSASPTALLRGTPPCNQEAPAARLRSVHEAANNV